MKIALAIACFVGILGMVTPGRADNVHSYFSATGFGAACTLAAPCGSLNIAAAATISGGTILCRFLLFAKTLDRGSGRRAAS